MEKQKMNVDFSLKIIKIYYMRKCYAALFFLLFILALNCYAESYNQGGYVGTPPGFYDDIDPNAPDEDEEIAPNYQRESGINDKDREVPYHTFSDESSTISGSSESVKATKNYSEIYNNLEPANFSYLHNIDPDQYYDTKDAAWSIYPLLRLNSAIYFKNQTIEPGYYLLTPREHKGKWYMLFKQNGVVVHIIPVYERGYTPELFYDQHIPKPKLTKSQKIHMAVLNTVGKTKSSKRKEPVKSFLEVNDLDNYFVSLIVYYGGHKYSTLFRTIRL